MVPITPTHDGRQVPPVSCLTKADWFLQREFKLYIGCPPFRNAVDEVCTRSLYRAFDHERDEGFKVLLQKKSIQLAINPI